VYGVCALKNDSPDSKKEPSSDAAIFLPNVKRLRNELVPGLDSMPPAIEFLPPQITKAKMYCLRCQRDVPVPLEKTFSERHTPVFPNDYDPVTNNKFWQLVTVDVECPRCNTKVRLQLPRRSWTKTVNLYGDEAVREAVTRPFVCIALVGGSSLYLQAACDKVTSLKTKLEPDRDPSSWRFHMTDLHSGQKRQCHDIFSTWSRDKCEQARKALCNIIADSNDSLFVFVVVYPMSRGSSMIVTKRKAYMAVLCDTIYNFTQIETSPRYTFDADKAVDGTGPVIQNWARSAFLGSERQVMYLYLCHGVPVLEPQFVKPGSHVGLELADFVAFVVARELYCWQKRLPSEYKSSELGKVYYSWPDAGGYTRERTIGVLKDQVFRTR
jgi:hypothetical protein